MARTATELVRDSTAILEGFSPYRGAKPDVIFVDQLAISWRKAFCSGGGRGAPQIDAGIDCIVVNAGELISREIKWSRAATFWSS